MKNNICQSCGMPLAKPSYHGTNSDKSPNSDYCRFCYQEGKFLDEGITLQEKIEKNIKIAIQMGISEEKAKNLANSTLPKLKRWQNQKIQK